MFLFYCDGGHDHASTLTKIHIPSYQNTRRLVVLVAFVPAKRMFQTRASVSSYSRAYHKILNSAFGHIDR